MSERRDLFMLPAQGLKWLGARLTDLLTATGSAVAALAGFVWALSPWLVFAALAAGLAALVSVDARGWLTTQATRAGALMAGDQAGPPGFLYLEAPQVYTRERLVNDRFTQANWLREQLERTGRDSFMEDFSRPSSASEQIQRLTLMLRAEGLLAPSADGEESGPQAAAPSSEQVALDRLELFDKVNVYRGAVRGELMDVQLDDGHDLDGNTLYRLNFNAVVAPFYDRRSYPGSAVFMVRAMQPDRGLDEAQLIEDEKELLRQWQREMQAFLTRVLEQRLEDFERQSALENPTDPKEDMALDWFMRTELVKTFLTYLNNAPGEAEPYLISQCDDKKAEFESKYETAVERMAVMSLVSAAAKLVAHFDARELWEAGKLVGAGKKAAVDEMIRDCRINELSRLVGFNYRTDAPSPDMLPSHAAGFRRSIELAHLVNVAQWPKVGPGSYDERCVFDEMNRPPSGNGRGQPPGAEEGPLAGTDPPPAADPPASASPAGGGLPNAPEGAGGGVPPVTPVSINDGTNEKGIDDPVANQTSPGGAGPETPAELNTRLARKCLEPYTDPYRLRALIRLLSVTEDLHRHSLTAPTADKTGEPDEDGAENEETAQDPVAPMTRQEARAAVADILVRVGDVLPERALHELDPSGDEVRFTINALKEEVAQLITDGGQLANLQQRCDTLPDTGADRHDAAIKYARCRFLYAPSSNVRGLLAEFIVARVRGDLSEFYRETTPAVKEFLDVTTDGCMLTSCRIRVDLLAKKEDAVAEAALAKKLAKALDERTNGLSIYEIAPRADTVIRHAGGGRDVSVGLAAPQGRASADASLRDRTAYAEAVVLGFGQAPAAPGSELEDAQAVFGWTVRPQPRPGGGWTPSHHRLSAVVSVPSWWKRLDLEIHACWIGPQAAREHSETLFGTPSNICATVHGKKPSRTGPSAAAADTAQPAADPGGAGYFMRPVRVQLPRSVDEVTARFNFDLVKTPYFDPAWKRDHDGASNALTAGRPAHIALAGERLWRGTVVTIDGQPADRITVLPDMKGVIAEFRCVRPAPGASPDGSDRSRAKLTVWTAEGRTKPMDVNIQPFDAVKDTDEKPCYMQTSRATENGK